MQAVEHVNAAPQRAEEQPLPQQQRRQRQLKMPLAVEHLLRQQQ
jgi:hypothetical protein